MKRLLHTLALAALAVAASALATPADVAGSYQLAPGHVIDIGPMDEMGGALVFIDHKSLQIRPMRESAPDRYTAGPVIGKPAPVVFQADFVRDGEGRATGVRWRDGKRTVLAKRIAPHRVEAVTVVNGAVTLKGSLLLPLRAGPHPAVVLAHGSGDATRNAGFWNMFFVRQGFAVLSLDKRGAGASGGDWHHAGMEDLAGDWLAGVGLLRKRADIDPRRIGVHGSSQGGWTAPLMAVRDPALAFVIVRAGSAINVRDTMLHEIAWSVREAGFGEADAKRAADASRQVFALAGGSWQEHAAFVARFKDEPWIKSAWPLNATENGWGRAWSAKNASYEPAATLARLTTPTLWFLGALDHNVPVDASERALQAARSTSGNRDLTIVRLPGTGHAFTQSVSGNNGAVMQESRMTSGYFDRMARWLRERGFSQP